MNAPKRTGTLEGPLTDASGKRYYRGKVRLLDGARARVQIPEPKCYSETAARDFVAFAQEHEDRTQAIYRGRHPARASAAATHGGETATQWYRDRYLALHAKLGNTIGGHIGSWMKWVAPFFGTKPLTGVTVDDVKAARDNLTRARLAGEIGAKRALNVWADQIRTPLGRAFSDDDPKYASVRVGAASANPALAIKPPVSGDDKEADERERQALDPLEFLALVSHAARPLAERRFDAVATYTGCSPSELYGLRVADVRLDVERPHLLVQRGRDMRSGLDISTKTRQRNRRVPIHPELRPLLAAMIEGRADDDYLFAIDKGRVRDVESRVEKLREDLRAAGVTRPELLHGTDTLMPFDTRSFRTTFATWCAKAGYDSGWVRAWLGHKPQGVAEKHYVKDTPAFEHLTRRASLPGVVPPFPPLPAALLGPGAGPRDTTHRLHEHLGAIDPPGEHLPATKVRELAQNEPVQVPSFALRRFDVRH